MSKRMPLASDHMISRSRQLRHKASTPERLLWSKLRDGRCDGVKFRRQEPVGPYVPDFLCPSLRLIIELDGRSHDDQEVYDQQRQQYLERMGFMVVRVSNDRLLSDLSGVAEGIEVLCRQRAEDLGVAVRNPHPAAARPPSP